MAENDENASGLSAEAEVFIPRHSGSHGDGQVTVQQIPSYMMNCYPFVQQADFMRNRAPWFGNPRQQGFHGYRGNRKQRSFGGYHGNRMPGPNKYSTDSLMPYPHNIPPPPIDVPWNGILPLNPVLQSAMVDCTNLPNGVPFDGGTKSHDKMSENAGAKWKKSKAGNQQENQRHRKRDDNSNNTEDRWKNTPRHGQKGRTRHGAWGERTDTPRTVICKEVSVETDFPDRIANLTLQQSPSPLYLSGRRFHGNHSLGDSSDSDIDSDSGYSSPLHKRNQVSSGTHPAGFIETTKTHPDQSESVNIGNAKAAPQPKLSYAMIAQKVPTTASQNLCVQNSPLISDCDKNRTKNCDTNFSEGHSNHSNNSHQFKDEKMTEQKMTNNVENDAVEGSSGEKKKRKRNRKRRKKKNNENNEEDEDDDYSKEKKDVELHFEDEEEFPDLSGNKTVPFHSRELTPTVINDRIPKDFSESLMSAGQPTYLHNQTHYKTDIAWGKQDSGETTHSVLKRRDKTSNAWETSSRGIEPVKNVWGQKDSGNNVWGTGLDRHSVHDTSVVRVGPVVPDTAEHQNTAEEPSVAMGNPSYSEVLKAKRTVRFMDRKSDDHKTAPQKQLKKTSQRSLNLQSASAESKTTESGETRVTRKRRRRREIVNQAAEEELAEISLEQDMLRGLNLNPQSKTPATKATPKTASPVKEPNSPVPGILHTNASSGPAGGGGKKSKQLIALDLGAMIDALEKKKDVPEKVIVQEVKQEKKRPEVQEKSKSGRPHNVLDSSAPVKRGKEKENPKPKKPSPLKKVILKEREEKKQLRLLEENMTENQGAPVGIGVVSAESDLSQDAMSFRGSADYGGITPASNDLSPISQTSPISMSPLSPSASPLSSEVNSPVAGTVGREAIMKIHSRRFREYCNQVLNKDIDNCCTNLLQDLVRFQDRVYHRDPTKAKIKRRIVLGLREVTKHLKLKKIKCVVISPNLEKIQSKGGLDDALNNILNLCNQQDIPFVFALGRRSLGRACAKLVPVSVVGIFNYEGTEETFKQLMDLSEQARQSYKEMVSVIEKEIREYPTRGSAASAPHIYAHMGHSRTPSGASVLSFTSSILSEPISENYPHSEPETDSKGYEIVKDVEEDFGQFNFSPGVMMNKNTSHSQKRSHTRDIDDGNEADTEDIGHRPRVKGQHSIDSGDPERISDQGSQQGSDTVEELPHIDSIHSSTYDLSTEILSQHSGRTIENCEAMSTHSSRTLGDGSSTILADIGERSSKHDTPKSMESPSSTLQRGKVIDEERIKHWVDETQSRLENLQLQISGTEDSDDSSESEENSVDEVAKVVNSDTKVKSDNSVKVGSDVAKSENGKDKTHTDDISLNGEGLNGCEKSNESNKKTPEKSESHSEPQKTIESESKSAKV